MRRPANPLARTSLRARLTALTVVLVAAGLIAAGIATHYALEGFLIDRVDQEFLNPQGPLQNSLPPNSLGRDCRPRRAAPPAAYLLRAAGTPRPTDILDAVANPHAGDADGRQLPRPRDPLPP